MNEETFVLPLFVVAYRDSVAERRKDLFKTVAFIGRYGHTDFEVAMRMPMSDLYMYRDQLAELVEEERSQTGHLE